MVLKKKAIKKSLDATFLEVDHTTLQQSTILIVKYNAFTWKAFDKNSSFIISIIVNHSEILPSVWQSDCPALCKHWTLLDTDEIAEDK